MRAGIPCESRLRHARVFARIGGPHRLSCLPYQARQSDARSVSHIARLLDECFVSRARNAPGVTEAQHAGFVVYAKVSAAFPTLGLADDTYRRLDRSRNSVRLGEVAVHRVLQPQ